MTTGRVSLKARPSRFSTPTSPKKKPAPVWVWRLSARSFWTTVAMFGSPGHLLPWAGPAFVCQYHWIEEGCPPSVGPNVLPVTTTSFNAISGPDPRFMSSRRQNSHHSSAEAGTRQPERPQTRLEQQHFEKSLLEVEQGIDEALGDGETGRLEVALFRHGVRGGPRASQNLASAFAEGVATRPGQITPLLRFLGAADDENREGDRAYLPVAAAFAFVARIRAGKEVRPCWSFLAELAADERAQVHLAVRDAFIKGASDGTASCCWMGPTFGSSWTRERCDTGRWRPWWSVFRRRRAFKLCGATKTCMAGLLTCSPGAWHRWPIRLGHPKGHPSAAA